MQKIYGVVFNALWRATGLIHYRIRDLIVFSGCLLLMWIYFFSSLDVVTGEVQILGSATVMAMTIFSINGRVEYVEWNKWLYYPFAIFGLGILLIGQIHSIGDGYVMYALDLILIFPAFYYVWANRGAHDTLYKLISLSILVLGIASCFYCFYLASKGQLHVLLSISGTRISGLRANPNTFGRLGAICLLAGIYLIWEYRKNRILAAFFSTGIGVGLSYILLSASRTSMLCGLVCVLTTLVILIKGELKKIKVGKRSIVTIASIIIVISATLAMGLQMDDINNRNIQATHPEEIIAEINTTEKISERVVPVGNADTFSSGRIGIWKIYLDNAGPLGTEFKVIEAELMARGSIWAHNNIVDYLFRCGYIVGAIYIFFYAGQGIAGLRVLFDKKKQTPRDYFLVSAIGCYSALAMLDIATLCFVGCIPCIYFLSIAPIMANKSKEEAKS